MDGIRALKVVRSLVLGVSQLERICQSTLKANELPTQEPVSNVEKKAICPENALKTKTEAEVASSAETKATEQRTAPTKKPTTDQKAPASNAVKPDTNLLNAQSRKKPARNAIKKAMHPQTALKTNLERAAASNAENLDTELETAPTLKNPDPTNETPTWKTE